MKSQSAALPGLEELQGIELCFDPVWRLLSGSVLEDEDNARMEAFSFVSMGHWEKRGVKTSESSVRFCAMKSDSLCVISRREFTRDVPSLQMRVGEPREGNFLLSLGHWSWDASPQSLLWLQVRVVFPIHIFGSVPRGSPALSQVALECGSPGRDSSQGTGRKWNPFPVVSPSASHIWMLRVPYQRKHSSMSVW